MSKDKSGGKKGGFMDSMMDGGLSKTIDTLRGIGTLNAMGKQGRFMHENVMNRAAIEKRMLKNRMTSQDFAFRRGEAVADAQAAGNMVSNADKLRAISSSLNALNSQVN